MLWQTITNASTISARTRGSKKEQKTSGGSGNGKNQKRDNKDMDRKNEEKDSGRERRR